MRKEEHITIVIPARYGSTRFPGKPLALIHEKTMIEHVYRKAQQVKDVNDVIVATDDKRIVEAVKKFGGKVVFTSPDHQSGTDRVAEVAENIETDILVNLQGDEPFINPKAIEQVIKPLCEDKTINMTTLMKKISDESELDDPNVVKVVVDKHGKALYFSRSCIPYPRNTKSQPAFRHLGVYAYRKHFLINLAALEQTTLEKTESLEQLRALENGYSIKAIETNYDSFGIDTPEQLDLAVNSINRSQNEHR